MASGSLDGGFELDFLDSVGYSNERTPLDDEWFQSLFNDKPSESRLSKRPSETFPSPLLPAEESYFSKYDVDHFEPHIFGEPLHAATNFAWDLPEHRFKMNYRERHGYPQKGPDYRFNLIDDDPCDVLEPKPPKPKVLPDINALAASRFGPPSGNPNSKAVLGTRDLETLAEENQTSIGSGVPPDLVRRGSLGVFAPQVVKKKRTDSVIVVRGMHTIVRNDAGCSLNANGEGAGSSG